MKRYLVAPFFAALFVAAVTRCSAIGLIIVDEQPGWSVPILPRPVPPWPRPIPPRPHPFAPLEVHEVSVNTRITDQIAVTSIEQDFYNPNSTRLEGTFVFPVPRGAHLDKFAMEIDGKKAEAELLGADKARGLYEDIVRKLKDPALLEYAGRDIFKVRIFPIEPNNKKRVTLSYTQLLKSDEGLIQYNLPLDAGRFSAKPIKEMRVKVQLETKRPLKSIYSPTYNVEIKRTGPTHATASYEAHNVEPDTDFALYFAPQKDEIGFNLLTFKDSSQDGFFLVLASPGIDVKEKQVAAKDVVFVLDTSGSMAGKKLEQAKKALRFCIENLNDRDRFEILRFSTEVEPLFDKLADASKNNRERAEDWVKELKPTGGTAIADALGKMFDLRSRGTLEAGKRSTRDEDGRESQISASGDDRSQRPFVGIFLTDGRPTVGVTDEDEILARVRKQGEGRTRVFCFGIGTDVNTHLLDRIAEESRAFTQYVLPEEDIEVKVSSFYSKIKEPVLTNPTLRFTGDPRVTKLYPSPLPDLFKGEQLILVGRYSGKGDSAAVIEGAVNGASRKFTYEVNFPEHSSENAFIARLWATRRVGYLLDEIRLHGDNSELREEVTELARKHGIVTPYTAYLILEDEGHRNVPSELQSFRQLREDRTAYDVAGRAFQSLGREKTGDGAVVSSLSGTALRQAQNAPSPVGASPEQNTLFLRRYGLAAPNVVSRSSEGSAAERVTQYTQQQRYIAGKNFFQNQNQWIDSSLQEQSDAKRVRIPFGSSAYFEFLAKHREAAAWLALGSEVQILLENTIYEIYEER